MSNKQAKLNINPPSDEALPKVVEATPGAPIYGITVDQPDAAAIATGRKTLTVRGHGLPDFIDMDVYDGWFLLHAGTDKPTATDVKVLRKLWPGCPAAGGYHLSKVLCMVRVSRVIEHGGAFIWYFDRVLKTSRAHVEGAGGVWCMPTKDQGLAFRATIDRHVRTQMAVAQRQLEDRIIASELKGLMAAAEGGNVDAMRVLKHLESVKDKETIREAILEMTRNRAAALEVTNASQ